MFLLLFLIFFIVLIKDFVTAHQFKGVECLLGVLLVVPDVDEDLASWVVADQLLLSDLHDEIDEVISFVFHMLWDFVADNAARKVALAHGLAAGGAREDRLLRLLFCEVSGD